MGRVGPQRNPMNDERPCRADSAEPRCGAKTRAGTACLRLPCPGRRRRCNLHGGKTPAGIGSPHYRHGLRSRDVIGQAAGVFAVAEAEGVNLITGDGSALVWWGAVAAKRYRQAHRVKEVDASAG